MRIPKNWVSIIAKRIVENLINKEMIDPVVSVNNLIEETENIILDELMIEDRINEEVRQILKKYESDIEKGRLDYRKLFEMTKQKLVKERNVIL